MQQIQFALSAFSQKEVREFIMPLVDKDRVIEFIKYDFNHLKYPLVLAARLLSWCCRLNGKHAKAFNIASNVYRTGWAGSYEFGLRYARYYFFENKALGASITQSYIDDIQPLVNTQKFFDEPLAMLNGVVTVLKAPEGLEKGTLIIKYSYYFPLFIRLYDIKKVSDKFHIILEPSWAGYCDLNILSYLQFDFPVFVQAYEQRDKQFLSELNANIVPMDVGPSWFINHQNFQSPSVDSNRDIDIIMVAAWAKYKRHSQFFEAIKPLLARKPDLKICLIGYPVDETKAYIESVVDAAGFSDNVIIEEWITPEEVAAYQRRAKVNVLWSKFEGNNRAIIEGMFSDTPVIMREGHNYGEHYDFINEETGSFALEDTLCEKIERIIIDNGVSFSPRRYVMENRNCIAATKIMGQSIASWENQFANNQAWRSDLAVKVNELHGMKYLDADSHDFSDSYKFLASCKN